MSQLVPLDIIRRLGNSSWRLPCKGADDNSVTVTFFPSSQFMWEIHAANTKARIVQAVTGPEWRGNWSVRATPNKVVGLDSLPSSSARVLSSFGLSRNVPAKTPPGPYLVLNFTDLTKCSANITIMGTHCHFGDWLNHLWQLFQDGNFRVLDFDANRMRLECPGGKQVQIWERATEVHLPVPSHGESEE
jgi:hypothetical protein